MRPLRSVGCRVDASQLFQIRTLPTYGTRLKSDTFTCARVSSGKRLYFLDQLLLYCTHVSNLAPAEGLGDEQYTWRSVGTGDDLSNIWLVLCSAASVVPLENVDRVVSYTVLVRGFMDGLQDEDNEDLVPSPFFSPL